MSSVLCWRNPEHYFLVWMIISSCQTLMFSAIFDLIISSPFLVLVIFQFWLSDLVLLMLRTGENLRKRLSLSFSLRSTNNMLADVIGWLGGPLDFSLAFWLISPLCMWEILGDFDSYVFCSCTGLIYVNFKFYVSWLAIFLTFLTLLND